MQDLDHDRCCVIQIDSGICCESCGRARTSVIGATSSKPTDGICCESCMMIVIGACFFRFLLTSPAIPTDDFLYFFGTKYT